jgi:hypothetical protein
MEIFKGFPYLCIELLKIIIMKKVTIFILSLVIIYMANGQEMTTKKGFTILPEAGDIALGFDAVPFFDFLLNTANIMNNTGQTSQHPGYVSGFASAIVGKYFLEDNMAARVKFGVNTFSFKGEDYFDDPADVLAVPATDPDTWKEISDVSVIKGSDWVIGAGLEFRRGHNRLQGFYGAELIFGMETASEKYTYGVEQNLTAVTEGYWNADGTLVEDPRVLSLKDRTGFTLGLRGFVGVEYFFAPKMSVSGEFGWGPGYRSLSRGATEIQSWDAVNNVSETRIVDGPEKDSFFGFIVDDGAGRLLVPSAALTLLFHF